MGAPSKPKKSSAQKELEAFQLSQLRDVEAAEKSRGAATARGRLGRASLITGSARGVVAGETRSMKPTAIGIPDPVAPAPKKRTGFLSRT
jgi:hypothetical protein